MNPIDALAQCSAIKGIYPATKIDLGPGYDGERAFIEFPVTQPDIDLGVRKDCFECAVSRALQRAVGPNWQVQVHPTAAAIRRISDGQQYFYKVPFHTRCFIQAYDHPGSGSIAIHPCKLRIYDWDPQPTAHALPMMRMWNLHPKQPSHEVAL